MNENFTNEHQQRNLDKSLRVLVSYDSNQVRVVTEITYF